MTITVKLLNCTCGGTESDGLWMGEYHGQWRVLCALCHKEGPPGGQDLDECRRLWNKMIVNYLALSNWGFTR